MKKLFQINPFSWNADNTGGRDDSGIATPGGRFYFGAELTVPPPLVQNNNNGYMNKPACPTVGKTLVRKSNKTKNRKTYLRKLVVFAIAVMMVNLFFLNDGYAQIAQRGTATTAAITTTSVSINKPSGVVQNDVMIVNIEQGGNTGTNPICSGWTPIAGAITDTGGKLRRQTVLYKVAGALEGSSYTFTLGTGVNEGSGAIVAFLGVDVTGGYLVGGATGGPFDVAPGTINITSTASTTATANSITTATSDAAVIMFASMMDGGSGSAYSAWSIATGPTSLTELYDYNNSSSTEAIGAAWTTKSTAGITGYGTVTLSAIKKWGAILLALKPFVCTTSTWLGTTSTDWFEPTNWDCDVPGATTNVTIPSGGNQPNIIAPGAVCNNITINSGATLTISGAAANTLTVSGTTSISGNLNIQNTGNHTFTGDVSVNSTGVWIETAAAVIGFAGHLQNDGTLTASTGIHTFTGTGKTISGVHEVSIPALTISGTTTNNGTLTVSSTLAGASTLTNGAAGILNFGGSSISPTLAATAVGNTVNYTGIGAQAVLNTNYYNLGFSGAHTTYNITINGAVGIAGILTKSATFTSGSFVLSGSTVTFNGTGQSIQVLPYNNLTLSGSGTKTFAGSTAIGGLLSIGIGVIADLGTANHTAASLQLNSVAQPGCTFGGTGSTASFINTIYFAPNTGKVTVSSGNYAFTSTVALAINAGMPTTVTLSGGANIPDGTYTVSYTVTGTNSFSGTPNITFISGTGTFLTNIFTTGGGSNTLTINSLSNGCSTAISANNSCTVSVTSTGTLTYPAAGSSFTPPFCGNYTVQVWGGGGSGGGASRSAGTVIGGGGAGGAYATAILSLTISGGAQAVTVGAQKTVAAYNATASTNTGNFSWFGSSSTVYARGGAGGAPSSSGTGTPGTGSNTGCIPTPGTAGSSGSGGAGGQGANGGGAGGAQRTSNNDGNSGTAPGGGGGGGWRNSNGTQVGGMGAAGQVIVSWTCPSASISYSSPYCKSVTSANTILTGSTCGTYSYTGPGTLGSFSASDGTFNPSTSGAGIYTVHYQIAALGGCAAVDAETTVTVLPVVSYGTASDASGNTQTICYNTAPAGNMVASGATGSGSFTYQWYYQNAIVSAPSGTDHSAWTACTSTEGTGFATATFTASAITSNRTYTCFVIPGASPTCGIATWATGAIQITVSTSRTWIGGASGKETDWNEPTNWCGGIPTSSTNVVIPSGGNQPHIGAAGGLCNNITINSGASLTIDGANNLILSGSWTNSGGTFTSNSSTVTFNGTSATIIPGSSHFYHVSLSGSASVSTSNLATLFVDGNLNVAAGTTLSVSNPSPALSVAGTTTVAGILACNGAGKFFTGDFSVSSGGSCSEAGPSPSWTFYGNFNNDGSLTFTQTPTYNFSGTSGSQTINGNTATTFYNLTINNTNGLSLNKNITVANLLTFTSGKITAGSNILSLGSSATVSGAGSGKYVYGSLLRPFSSSSLSFTFDIGDASNYTPAAITFSSISTAGNITANTISGQHPTISTSGINSIKDVARYWTISNSGIASTNYSATFNFVSGDVIGGAATGNFVARKYSSSEWSALNVGTKNTSNTQITGITGFGDFVLGEQLADATQSTLTPATASITADGTSTQILTVQAKDANGNNLTSGGSTVTITKSSGTGTIGSVTDVGNGTYTASVTSPTSTGSGIFEATLGAAAVKSGTGSQTQSTISYIHGSADATNSTLIPTSATITANGSATQLLTVTAKDVNNNFVTGGGANVTITKSSGTGTIGSVTDIGNGTYTATVTSPSATGNGVFVATLSGNPVKSGTGSQTQSTITYSPGTADATQSTLTPATASITANGTTTQILTVQAKDVNGNNLTTGGSTVTITKQSGTGTIGSLSDIGNGTYTATVTAPTSTGIGLFVSTLGGAPVKSGTGSQTQATITYTPGNATKYLVTSSSYSPVARQDVTITAQLTDANNNPVNTSGLTVTWTKSDSNGSFATATSNTNSSGVATVTFTTHTVAGTATTVTGTDGSSLTGTSSTITTGTGSLDHFAISSISSPQTIGTAITGITLTAQDANNNTITSFNGTVAFSGTAGITGTSASFSSGQLTGVTVTPSAVGTNLTFVVTASGKTGTSTFQVNPAAPSGSASQIFCTSASPTVADLAATGSNIQWYAAASGGSSLATSTPLSNNTHYYASQTLNSLESVARFDIKATVYPNFTAGTISNTGESICYNGDPSLISSSTAASGGDGNISYQWQKSAISSSTGFTDISGATNDSYNPPANLTATTWYRRQAQDGTCSTGFTSSTGVWQVTVRGNFTPGAILTTGETICYNGNPSQIGSSTAASGGDASITYKWESSTNGFVTSGTLISDATSETYNPPTGLTITTSYRRYAHDGTCNTSFEVSAGTWTVTVRADFTPGAIETAGETICYSYDPGEIGSATAASGGNGSITYKWESSTDGFATSGTLISDATSEAYNPPTGLTATTSYRRYAHDGACNTSFELSSGTWIVTVLNNFTAGTIASTGETICYNGNPGEIGTTAAASGGDESISYRWQSSTDIGFTSPANINANTQTYDPPAGLTTTTWYRRQAHDATCNTGWNNSTNVWKITVYEQFTAGTIANTGETICYAGTPSLIGSSSDGSGGHGTITYQWQSSLTSDFAASTVLTGSNSATYTPADGLTVTTWYRRQAHDATCNTGWITSGETWKVTVYEQFTAGAILPAGQTICYAGTPGEAGSSSPAGGGHGTITYQWQSSLNADFTGTPTVLNNSNSATYTPGAGLTVTTWYRRKAKDATCNTVWNTSTGTWKVTVVDTTAPTGPATQTYCSAEGKTISDLTATLTSGTNIKWYSASTNGAQYLTTAVLTTGSYFASQTNGDGCESTTRLEVAVTINANPDLTGLTTTASDVCQTEQSVVTLSATTLPNGTYSVNYTLTGNNAQSAADVLMSVTGGSNSGTFTTPSLTAAGTTTVTINSLTLNSCPTTATSGNTNDIKITATGTWLGSTSTAWNTLSNWCGGVPTSSTEVVIPSGGNQPTINGAAVCNTITINDGATVTVSGSNTLTISANFVNNGTFTPNTGTVIFDGTSTISGSSANTFNNLTISGTLTGPSTASMNITGNWSNNGTFTHNNGTVVFTGTGTQSLGGSGTSPFNNLTVNKSSGSIQLTNDPTINGALTLTSGLIDGITNSKTLTIGSAGSATAGNSDSYVKGQLSRIYGATGSKNFPVGNGNYHPMSLTYTQLTGTSTVTVLESEDGITIPSNILPSQITNAITPIPRHWTVSQSGGSGFRYTVNLDGTGITPSHPVIMILANHSTVDLSDVTTPNYTNAKEFTSFSDLGLGELAIKTSIADDSWNTDGTWLPSGTPVSTDNVFVNNAVTIGDSPAAFCHDLTINTAKMLTIGPDRALTVSGTLTNSAGTSGLVLSSDTTGTASLIHNSADVPATVTRYITGAKENWHFLSSPVTEQTIGGDWLPSGTYGNGTGYDLYLWNEPTSCWIYKLNTTSTVNWNTVHPQSYFIPGRGYLYSVQAKNPVMSFSGTLTNGAVEYVLTSASADTTGLKGFNLVGNPYPSSIDWQASTGWSRSTLKASGSGYDMWIWNQSANNYGVCNSYGGAGTNDITRYIAPMQGFFVRAASAGNLGFSNSIRVHDGANSWKSSVLNSDVISAVVQSGRDGTFDEVRLLFGYSAGEIGAAKLFSPVATAPSLYLNSGNSNYTVRYLSDTIAYPTVPVNFKAGSNGAYTLSFTFDSGTFKNIFLEDKQTKVILDLKSEPLYRFNASVGDQAGRFVLHFVPVKPHTGSELHARIYTDGHKIFIDLTKVVGETRVSAYDVLGRKAWDQTLTGESLHPLSYIHGTQFLIIQLQNPQGRLVRKIVCNNTSQ